MRDHSPQLPALGALLPENAAAWPPGRRRMLRALRLHLYLGRRCAAGHAGLGALLDEAAGAFEPFVDEAVGHWPEPFLVFPPSSPWVSPDEAALVRLVDEPSRAAFWLGELLPMPTVERLATLAYELADLMPLD